MFQLAPGAQSVIWTGSYSNSSWWLFFPSMSVADNGDSMLTVNLSSTTQYPEVAGRGMSSSHVPLPSAFSIYKSTVVSPVSRWGDFSGTANVPGANSFYSAGMIVQDPSHWAR